MGTGQTGPKGPAAGFRAGQWMRAVCPQVWACGPLALHRVSGVAGRSCVAVLAAAKVCTLT